MAEKCWCGLETITDPGMAPYIKSHPRCPVHGEKWSLSQEQVAALVEAVREEREFAANVGLQAADWKRKAAGDDAFWEFICWLNDYATDRVIALEAALALLPEGESDAG